MPLLGAHMSIAGGFHEAVNRAAAVGCEVVQIFTKNNNQWAAKKEITDEDVSLFRGALAEHGISHTLVHASYLINLASPDKELWQKSLDAMVIEVQRAGQLGIPFIVFHPGSHTTTTEAAGLKSVARALNQIHKKTPKCNVTILLENTAGQGTNLGWRFEHLAAIMEGIKDQNRIGVCFDTCHAFAAGYAMTSAEEYAATMDEFNDVVGLEHLAAFHLNDSKKEFGSRKDRHENIGQGEMGLEPFHHLLNDQRFDNIPMFLETPKDDIKGEPGDAVNLRTLRSLIR